MPANKNILLFVSLVLFDQIFKHIIRSGGGFYICNLGVAFGLEVPRFLFWIFWVLGIAIFLYFSFLKKKSSNESNKIKHDLKFDFYIVLVISGAASNIIDRVSFGCVIDFIDIGFWPVFNFADIFIFLGALGLILDFLSGRKKKML